jgi:hypothetical protein
MAPQPLSRVASRAVIKMEPIDLGARPSLAPWIAKCIAKWSDIELTMGLMMVAFLGESATPTVAIYTDLLAFRTRVDALAAAAKNTLIIEHFTIFEAIISILRKATKQRDRLAHHIWTYSDQISDALLLTDPRDLLPAYTDGIKAALAGTAKKGTTFTSDDVIIPYDKVYVYKEQDLIDIYKEFELIGGITSTFVRMILSGNDMLRQYRLYYMLSQEPRIHAFLSRQKSENQNAQGGPEPPHQLESDGSGI